MQSTRGYPFSFVPGSREAHVSMPLLSTSTYSAFPVASADCFPASVAVGHSPICEHSPATTFPRKASTPYRNVSLHYAISRVHPTPKGSVASGNGKFLTTFPHQGSGPSSRAAGDPVIGLPCACPGTRTAYRLREVQGLARQHNNANSPRPDITDASQNAVGASLQQRVRAAW